LGCGDTIAKTAFCVLCLLKIANLLNNQIRPAIGTNEQGEHIVECRGTNQAALVTGETFAFDYVFGPRSTQVRFD
jgi:hypothetical protein